MKNRPRMLSATFVRNVNLPGRYGDGRGGLGLSLLVKPASRGGFSKSWSQSVRLAGRPTSIGLGRYPVVTLAMARERALENARAIAEGRDPRRRSACTVPTFAEACETVIAIHAGSWKPGGRTEESWRASLRDYALPRLGEMPVHAVAGADVMDVLLPIWFTKRDTARSVRQRIGAVMKWAIAQGHRPDNPAGDTLSAALPNNAGPRAATTVPWRTPRSARRSGGCALRAPSPAPCWRSSSWCSPPRARARSATRAGRSSTSRARCGRSPPSA